MKKIKSIISFIFLLLSGFLAGLTLYIMFRFQNVRFEQLIYSLFYAKGSSINSIGEGIFIGSIIIVIYLVVALFPFYGKWTTHKKKIFPINKKFFFPYSIYMFLLMFFVAGLYFGLFSYIYYQFNTTNLFDYYVEPRDVEIKFPDNKKNLIYIFVESLEISNTSNSVGGFMKKSWIPNLERLALDNTNFSNTDNLGGALQVDGVNWTIGGMIGQTSGIPLKILVQGNHYNEYSKFLPGAYSIGEVLKSNGYDNYLMLGSDAFFGGRGQYFKEHGDYVIYDYYWAKDEKVLDDSYYEWWGFEDSKLFTFAEKQLLEISSLNKPFNFTILTADTHFPNGYIDQSCNNNLVFDNHYANSFYCSDKMIYDFVEWVMKQEFYKDTVIVISGDHLVMQGDLYKVYGKKERVIYNSFINSYVEMKNNKNRLFTTMDMYPTTLAAMGATISGDKLGLGTNLYSDEKTLIEELGYKYVSREIYKKSDFYNKYILKDTYREMYKNVGKKYNDDIERR